MNASTFPITEVEIRAGVRLSNGPALFLESARAIIVADVHWGYAFTQRTAGRLVPQWGDEDITRRLDALIAFYAPRQLIIAGDIVHGPPGVLAAGRYLERVAPSLEVFLVGGNHDRRSQLPSVDSHELPDAFIHHGDTPRSIPTGKLEIVGHHHPAFAWNDGAGTALKLPALVDGPHRLILPAFSPWAAGVPWNLRLRPGEKLWAISARRIFPWAIRN